FATFSLQADGSRAQHALQVSLAGDAVAIDAAVDGGERDGRWRGTLTTLQLAPKDRETWNLRAPAELAYDHEPQLLRLAESCLDAAPATLCAALDWSDAGGEARFSLQELALAQLDPLLTAALDAPLSAYGSLSANGTARRDAAGVVT
ncbi:hypothetical protein, partial [Bradyrhizobium sp. NBAIM08]|uniref:hypothetical protein n=1 Tax=Bradyrhizobium sp. NBAIM08 TaxID=2793815 RepID=UPI001CD228E2